MITYDWNCKTVDVYPTKEDNTDVVYNVHWILTGTNEDGITSTSIGTQNLSTDNIENFIPISELTNTQIAQWVEASMGEDGVAMIKEGIQKAIKEIVTPSSVTITIEN